MNRRTRFIGLICAAVAILCFVYIAGQRHNVWRNVFTSGHSVWRNVFTSGRKQVLVKAYFRGGSTFLGSMLKSNPGVFYYYEPLHALSWMYYWGIVNKVHYLNGTQIEIGNRDEIYQDIMAKVLSCRYNELWVEVLSDSSTNSFGSKEYQKCVGKNVTIVKINECLPILNKQCINHSIVATKTIRYPMRLAERLVSDQSVIVLHQVRDPRASLHSQMKYKFLKAEQLKSAAIRWCTEMYEDVEATRRLNDNHPGSVKLLYYEHITLHTERIVKDIYQFLGIPFVKEVQQHIKDLRAKDDTCFMCLKRSDPVYQLNKWRSEIKFEHVKIIDESCGRLYNLLGYSPAGTEPILRDLKHPLLSHSLDL